MRNSVRACVSSFRDFCCQLLYRSSSYIEVHIKVSESVTQNMIAWKTSSGCAHSAVKMMTDIDHSSKTKVFIRYVEDILRTERGENKELLDAVNNLHPNLQFTLETTDDKSLPILDMSINVQSEGTIFCTWYQKPSDTGSILGSFPL